MRFPSIRCLFFAAAVPLLACVPADKETGLGSVQFTFIESVRTQEGLREDETRDGYALSIDRVIFGFKTMTVGKIGTPDLCSYTGRGALANAVFDGKTGLVQTFNGVSPVDCPDVGIIFGPVDNATVPASGTPSSELVELDESGLHALIDATATEPAVFDQDGTITQGATWKIELRFEPTLTATRFGGCREAEHGVHIVEGERQSINMIIAAENLFRNAISSDADFAIEPFVQADLEGNADHVTTMDELDNLVLSTLSGGYQIPITDTEGATFPDIKGDSPSLGDFVRYLFRFAFSYATEDGLCIGNEPGSTEP